MEEKNIQEQVNEINKKLDLILKEMDLQRKQRNEMEDLKEDLMRVGKDVYQTAVIELEGVHDSLQTGDVLHLSKKLLRNVNTISKSIEQMESLRDFLQDFTPISRESVIDLMNKLDEFDRKGYFQFMKEFGNIADNIVTSFSVEDVKALGDNIVTILNTIKNLTQPDMLHAINNAVSVYKKLDITVDEKISYFTLFKRMNTPEMRRGIAFAIRFLKSLAETQQEENNITNIKNISKN